MRTYLLVAVVVLTSIVLFSTSLLAQAAEVYNCSFESSGFIQGTLAGQGSPAWSQYFRSGTDSSGKIVDLESDPINGGSQSLLLSGNQTNWLNLGAVTIEPWFEFAFRPSFDGRRSGAVAYVKTIRGNVGDVEGISLKLTAGTKKLNVNGVDIGSFVNGRWQTISFRHVVSGIAYTGTFEVFLNGISKGTINAGTAYDGLKTIVFSTAVESGMDALDVGKIYVDRIHIGSSSIHTAFSRLTRPERHLMGWTTNFVQDYTNKVDYFDKEIGVTDIWMDYVQQAWASTCPNAGFTALIDSGALPALEARGIRYWFGEHEAFTTMVNDVAGLRNDAAWNSLCFKAKGIYGQAKNLGFRGLVLDAEDYTGVTQAAWDMYIPYCDYVDAWSFGGAIPANNEFGATGKYYTRGLQYGTAVKSVWPDCIVLQAYAALAYGSPREGNYWWLKGIYDAGLEIWVATEQTYGAGYNEMGTSFYNHWFVNMANHMTSVQAMYPFASRIVPGFFPWDSSFNVPSYLPQYLDQQMDQAKDCSTSYWIYTQGLAYGGDPRQTLDRTFCSGFGVTPEDYVACFGRHLTSRSMVEPTSISSVKSMANDRATAVAGIVTYAGDGFFYLESKDRACGIRCVKAAHGLALGSEVEATGIMGTLSSGERYVNVTALSSAFSGKLAPLAVNNRAIGGGDFMIGGVGQVGVTGGTGLNNIGLLIKTTGKVTSIAPDGTWFTISDGSGVDMKILTAGGVPPLDDVVTVTGVVSCQLSGAGRVPVVLMNEMSYTFVRAASVYGCGFEAAEGFDLGALAGQGTPAWEEKYSSSYDAGGIVDSSTGYGGSSRSAYITGYSTSRLTLGAVTRAPWYEFAFRTNFAGGGSGSVDDNVWMRTTRGQFWDVVGVSMWVIKKDAKIILNTSEGDVDLGPCPDQTWKTISFQHDVSGDYYTGGFNVYVDGQFKGHYTSGAGNTYNGLQTLVFSTNSPSWTKNGALSVDNIRVSDASAFVI